MCAIIDKYMVEELKKNMNTNQVVKYSGLALESVLKLLKLLLS